MFSAREETIIGIKIECEESNMFPYELHLYQKEELEQNPRQVIEKVLGHENSPGSVEAIDGDLNTRWNTESQHEGQVFDVMLTEATEISGIQLDTGFWPDDYPRNLRIFLSEDGENFREVSYDTRDWKIYLFEKTRVKQIRLITGVQPEPVQNDWSISEVLVLTEE